jgi:hypothetical protein
MLLEVGIGRETSRFYNEKKINKIELKGTVSPDYKCLEVISIKSPFLGHVTTGI